MKEHLRRRPLAGFVVIAIAIALSIAFAPSFASAADTAGQQASSQSLAAGEVSVIPEWAIDDGQDAQEGELGAQAVAPGAYDLRNDGLVTPVKFQNPWGSCWAFGGMAAAETSILSAYGSTYAASGLDLSERHLTYFALQPVTESVDPKQVGEGMHTLDTSTNAAYDAGGYPIFITSLFSQGIGPMPESMFPYRGVGEDGKTHTTLEYFNLHPEEVAKDQMATEAKQKGMTYDQYIAKTGKTEDEIVNMYVEGLRKLLPTFPLTYSKFDDWSIPETNDNGTSNRLLSAGVVLKNGNVLPEYWNADKTAIVDASKTAIKQELLNGHGVSIKYWADQGGKYTNEVAGATGKSTQYGQYVFDSLGQNHGVCIVGWDDSYPADNFYHKVMVKLPDGTEVEDEAATAKTKPKEGNGAWIVKNSWGSETDYTVDDLGNTINKFSFGNKNDEGATTGYFYLSYYDKTINQPETMEFSANLGTGGSFYAIQYDYVPAYGGFYSSPKSSDVVSSANVFTAEDAIEIKSVSTSTSETNMRVTFAIYEMNDNAKDPADGELLYRTSQNFEYGGFHRLDLERPVAIAKGKKYSVVSTASTLDNGGKRSYNVAASRSLSKKAVEQLVAQGKNMKSYGTAVVNEGESFLYDGKKWQDWSSYIAKLPVDPAVHAGMSGDSYIDLTPIDNFSIKVYAEKAETTEASWIRLGGETAYGTMTKAVNEGWKSADTVVVATFDGYWDALAASALAGSEHAPVLLTDRETLSPETSEFIKSLGAKKAYICGGTAAVSDGVAQAIGELGVEVERFGGEMAFNTAELISAKAKATLGNACNTCVIATIDGFYDSLSVAPAAYNLGLPVYLTGADKTLEASTVSALKDAGYTKAVIVGGTAAVKSDVEEQLGVIGIDSVERLGGENAWQTSELIAEWGLKNGLSAAVVAVADGNGYWDALTGAPLVGLTGGSLVLVPHDGPTYDNAGTMTYDPYCINHFVTDNAASIKHGYVFGGPAAVSDTALDACTAATHKALV